MSQRSKLHLDLTTLVIAAIVTWALGAAAAAAGDMPPPNPFLADTVYPLGHGD
jgi:hypothetical protein